MKPIDRKREREREEERTRRTHSSSELSIFIDLFVSALLHFIQSNAFAIIFRSFSLVIVAIAFEIELCTVFMSHFQYGRCMHSDQPSHNRALLPISFGPLARSLAHLSHKCLYAIGNRKNGKNV